MLKKVKAFFSRITNRNKEQISKQQVEEPKIIKALNRLSLFMHLILSFLVVFLVELFSRRNIASTYTFLDGHTMAFLYNAFLVFCSLLLVYLFRRRTFVRVIIVGFWMFLGIVNGCILSNRVTPFAYTDIKCIPELFSMTANTNYFTAEQAMIVVLGVVSFVVACTVLFIKGPKYQGQLHWIAVPVAVIAMLFVGIPMTTQAAQNTNILTGYFANIAQGYENYGFIYGFSCSVVDRGMDKPEDYSEETIQNIEKKVHKKRKQQIKKEKKLAKKEEKKNPNYKKQEKENEKPNIICVLLESFCDPDEIKFLKVNKDPIPTFHKLEKNYTSGYLTVPVVGAGTANTEFEILTGMSMQHFGTGEYPYKTILKKTACESVASDLADLGYGTHVVHNNGGNFYSRTNAFSMFGFDTFTSKEMLDITKFTPNGSWAEDGIMVPETTNAMNLTTGTDFTYVITVGSHGDYPKQQVIPLPDYQISGVEDEEKANQWTYYVNQLNEVDTFMHDLIQEVKKRDEKTVIVFFGDHLPTMGLENADMKSNNIYKTKYVTWDNMGLKKADKDLYAYQLMADTLNRVGIHHGTIMKYHQTQMEQKNQEHYQEGLYELQYDLLYGKKYAYHGEDKYPASDLVMGTQDVELETVSDAMDGEKVLLTGTNFTKWSRVYVNDKKVNTKYFTGGLLAIDRKSIQDGDVVVVNQLGSRDVIFRSSNPCVYHENMNLPTASPEPSATAETVME